MHHSMTQSEAQQHDEPPAASQEEIAFTMLAQTGHEGRV